jgi:hypothetical protein
VSSTSDPVCRPPARISALRTLVAELGPIADVLEEADHEARAKLYNDLDLELTFYAERRLVTVEAAVYSGSCRRGT